MIRSSNCYTSFMNNKPIDSNMLASYMPQIPFPVGSSFSHKRSPLYPHPNHFEAASLLNNQKSHPIQTHKFFTTPQYPESSRNNAEKSVMNNHHTPSDHDGSRFIAPHQVTRLAYPNKHLSQLSLSLNDLNSSVPTSSTYKYKTDGNLGKTSGIFDYTLLEGQKIACFNVGGERRLCLPQVLHLLPQFNITQINEVIEDLSIICSRCNPHQLTVLKDQNVLPLTVTSCGLITKSDAERLCKTLLYCSVEKNKNTNIGWSLTVSHNCFGKQKGYFMPDLYVSPNEKCIECEDCNGLFAPENFVGHSHNHLERKTCHWGFDSANWRHYLMLVKDEAFTTLSENEQQKLQDALEAVKLKFDSTSAAPYSKRIDHSDEIKPNKKTEMGNEHSAFRRMKIKETDQNVIGDANNGARSISKTPPVEVASSQIFSSREASQYPADYSPNLAIVKPIPPQGQRAIFSNEFSKSFQQNRISKDLTEFNAEQLNTIESRIIRSLLSFQNLTSGEKDFLINELNKLRQTYLNRIHLLMADKKDKTERLAWLSTQNEKLERKVQRLSKKRKESRKLAGKQSNSVVNTGDSIQETKEPLKLVKIQAKYSALKEELQMKTKECQHWKKLCETSKLSKNEESHLETLTTEDQPTVEANYNDTNGFDPQPDSNQTLLHDKIGRHSSTPPPMLEPSSDENEMAINDCFRIEIFDQSRQTLDSETDRKPRLAKMNCNEAFLKDLPHLHRHKPYSHKNSRKKNDKNSEADSVGISNCDQPVVARQHLNKEKSSVGKDKNKYLNLNDRILKKRKKKKRKLKFRQSSLCVSVKPKSDLLPPTLEKADSC